MGPLRVSSIAGCDQYMPIAATSVGTFVLDGLLAPGELVAPYTTIQRQERLGWADATGAYYKIVWVCNALRAARHDGAELTPWAVSRRQSSNGH